MQYVECLSALARHRTDQIVITSAGNSGQAWWLATGGDSKASFYLDASMSLSTMFASGLALARPEQKIWAFMGDGGFCMNPGMLMVERQMNLPNLTHFIISNRAYGACSNAGLPNMEHNDYAAMARGMGLTRIFEFDSVEKLEGNFDAVLSPNNPGHTFVVLEVEPFSDADQKLQSAGLQAGPELKFRFGRHLEATYGYDVFDYKL
jgi:thiamine pyrophosphate-dependent acetolactate synthase large subunit-like protein